MKRLSVLLGGAAALLLVSGMALASLQYSGPGTCTTLDDGSPACLLNGQNLCDVYYDGTCIQF